MKINLQAIRNSFSSYAEIMALRYETLKVEENTKNSEIGPASENKDYHLVLYKNNEIAANLALSPENKNTICVKQVNVKQEIWQAGIEQRLLTYAESWAKENGFSEIKVKCGQTGLPFYSKMNYTATNDTITENGILYHQMLKKLN